jgi:tmRNA-binding protein
VTRRELLNGNICADCGSSWLCGKYVSSGDCKYVSSVDGRLPVRVRVHRVGNELSRARLQKRMDNRGMSNVSKLARKILQLYKRRSAVKIAYKCARCGVYRVAKRQKTTRRTTQFESSRSMCSANSTQTGAQNRRDSMNRSMSTSLNLSLNKSASISSTKKPNTKRRSLMQELTRAEKQQTAARSRSVTLADFLQSLT